MIKIRDKVKCISKKPYKAYDNVSIGKIYTVNFTMGSETMMLLGKGNFIYDTSCFKVIKTPMLYVHVVWYDKIFNWVFRWFLK